jgi:hypothetical protein
MSRAFLPALAAAAVLTAGCTTRLIREGYSIEGKTAQPIPVAVKRNMPLTPGEAVVLGRVRAVEPGAGTNCKEGLVIEMFVQEARMVGADLVNVVETHKPDIWSSCFRAVADLLKFNDRERAASISSDPHYVEVLTQRAQKQAGASKNE